MVEICNATWPAWTDLLYQGGADGIACPPRVRTWGVPSRFASLMNLAGPAGPASFLKMIEAVLISNYLWSTL